jgi:hypothetical protein
LELARWFNIGTNQTSAISRDHIASHIASL